MFVVVVVVAQILVIVIKSHSFTTEVEAHEPDYCWEALPDDPGAELCRVRSAIEEVWGIPGALHFGETVLVPLGVNTGKVGVEVRAVAGSQLGQQSPGSQSLSFLFISE